MTRMLARLGVLIFWGLFAVVSGASADEFKVIQQDKSFSHTTLTLKKGDQITFVNADPHNHNVYSEELVEFDIKQLPGSVHMLTFPNAGETVIQCAIHPKMKLRVRVNP
jgi:plastocyanin